MRISTYCILHFVYAYLLSRIAHYAKPESTHIRAVCMNKQNKPIRQHTTRWQRFTRIISRVKSREASRSQLWQQQRLLRRHR